MLGLFITAQFCLGALGLGLRVFGRLLEPLDPAAKLGVAGLLSLGAIGTLTLFIGLLPGGLRWGIYAVALLGALGLFLAATRRESFRAARPEGIEWAGVAASGLAFLYSLVGALSPPNALEWDSLAYHLAVPKLWLQEGQIHYIPFIHHSNFPFAVDNLYIWGLAWGGTSGAKAFSLFLSVFGIVAIFGLARQLYGRASAWWAASAFATVPVVLWLSGTAYIDVSNGAYAGLGILFAALLFRDPNKRQYLWLAVITLGLAAGSKYTGLQTIFAAAAVLFFGYAMRRQPVAGFKAAAVLGFAALLVASPWYIRNVIWTGNPVYPFFYEKLGGRNWDARRSEVYRNEQQTFGIGRTESGRDPMKIGAAVLGLAYQPGRYINPGQEQGNGIPFGAVGVVIVGTMLLWAFSGRASAVEFSVLASAGLSLLMWYFLSQQSRYIVALAVPLCVLAGGAVTRLALGKLLAALTVLQAIYSFWLLHFGLVSEQLPVVTGKVSADEYLSTSPFYGAAKDIDKQVTSGKVALYDEVFGYWLNVPYFWANPGHSTVIPYDSMQTGEDYVREMKDLGFTHAYVNLAPGMRDPQLNQELMSAFGIDSPTGPLPSDESDRLMNSFEQKYVALLADAAVRGLLHTVQVYRAPNGAPTGVLLSL